MTTRFFGRFDGNRHQVAEEADHLLFVLLRLVQHRKVLLIMQQNQ